MITINIRDGLWGLGKSFDIEHSNAIKAPTSFGRDAREGRYFMQQYILAFINAGLIDFKDKSIFEIDRCSPIWMLALSKLDLVPDEYLFLGNISSKQDIELRLTALYEDFLIYLSKFAENGYKVNFLVYEPKDEDSYIQWLCSQFNNASWCRNKLIKPRKYELNEIYDISRNLTKAISDNYKDLASMSKNFNFSTIISKRNFND